MEDLFRYHWADRFSRPEMLKCMSARKENHNLDMLASCTSQSYSKFGTHGVGSKVTSSLL
jgi:hypothetical protein